MPAPDMTGGWAGRISITPQARHAAACARRKLSDEQFRLAPYSYDWIDNWGQRSRKLHELPEPSVGERFTSAFGSRPAGRILSVEPGVQLTGTITGAVMSYVLVPAADGTTRLLLKLVTARGRTFAPLLCPGDLVMARKQLRTLALLAGTDSVRAKGAPTEGVASVAARRLRIRQGTAA